MKKLIALVLALVCVLGMVGCNNRSMNYIISNEPSITGIVKETNENAMLIENDDGEYWVSLNVENKDSMTSFNIDDEVVVYYDGNVAESYPMQINTVYAITLKTPADRTEGEKYDKTSAEPTEDMSEIPGGTRFIIEIRDRTEEEQLTCAEAEELFYEDEATKYYFNVIKSQYIMVTYNNANSEDIVTALNAGRATIADLDKFGIEYHTEPKQ